MFNFTYGKNKLFFAHFKYINYVTTFLFIIQRLISKKKRKKEKSLLRLCLFVIENLFYFKRRNRVSIIIFDT